MLPNCKFFVPLCLLASHGFQGEIKPTPARERNDPASRVLLFTLPSSHAGKGRGCM